MSLLLIAIASVLPAAGSEPACAVEAPAVEATRDSSTHFRQARHFARKGWTEDALQEAAMARSTPEGAVDPEVWTLSAELAKQLQDIVAARCLAKEAVRLAGPSGRAQALLVELDRTYGYLTIFSAGDASTTTLDITPPRLFASAEHKAYVDDIVATHQERQPLPVRLALPAGTYVINTENIVVQPGRDQELVLRPRDTRPAWQSPALRLTTGVGLGLGDTESLPNTTFLTRLSATWPLLQGTRASLRLGAATELRPTPATDAGTEPPAGTLAGGVIEGVWSTDTGTELRLGGLVGWATAPGLAVVCPLSSTTCTLGQASPDPADHTLINGSGLHTGLVVGATQRRFGSLSWLGIGLTGSAGQTQGTVDNTLIDANLTNPDWSAWRVTAGLSLSLHL